MNLLLAVSAPCVFVVFDLSCPTNMAWFSAFSFVVACVVSSAAGATFQVQVGNNGNLAFDPETINAQPGDTVTYFFHPKVSLHFLRSQLELQLTFIRITRSLSPALLIHAIRSLVVSSPASFPQRISQPHQLQHGQSP